MFVYFYMMLCLSEDSRGFLIPGHWAHTHTVYVCSSTLTPSSARSALAGSRDQLGHPAYHKSASHSLKHGLADALKYILRWAAVTAVCTAVLHLSVQIVLSLDHFSVPSVLPQRDCFDQFTTALLPNSRFHLNNKL